MRSAAQQPINDGDGQTPLFPYGYGLTHADTVPADTTAPTVPGVPTSAAGTPTGSCRVRYTTNDWSSGFTGTVALTNTGTAAINPWRLTWSFTAGQTVTQSWSARVTQSGTAATAAGEAWSATLAPGATVSFGFNGSHQGGNPRPAAFTLNGPGALSSDGRSASAGAGRDAPSWAGELLRSAYDRLGIDVPDRR
jgi:beta-glucosidase